MKAFAVFGLSCLFSVTSVSLAHAAANPAGISYSKTTNVSLYGKRTGMLIAGRCNRYDPAFQAARAKGAEILAYLNAAQRPDNPVCALDTKFYMGDLGRVPLWPYPSYGQRVNWPGTHLADIRPGSAWILAVVKYIEGLMIENKVDGVFLDTINVRPWGKLVEYTSWPQWEKDKWADGAVDLVKRLDASRKRLRPNFIILNNGVWSTKYTTHGLPGEKYVNGVCLEHPPWTTWHKNYAAKPFGSAPHRRVLVITRTKADALSWSKVSGVTHVTPQDDTFSYPPVPVVSFTPLTDRL
jgi:hypothetical protein